MARSFVAAGLAFGFGLTASATLAQNPPVTVILFQKARQEVRSSRFADALVTLDALDAESRKPGMEVERVKLEPSLLFLRGVCRATLDRPDDALADFRSFLELMPNANVDPGAYPKKAYALFETARKAAARGGVSPAAAAARREGGHGSLGDAYARYRPDPRPAGDGGAEWGDGPVRFLMTEEERAAWERASDAATRSEIVTRFWAVRDPTPGTPENEFREEFDRRVSFADAALGDGERRGSLTDRGRVFVLLGPPTWLGRGNLTAAEDASDVRPDNAAKTLDSQSNYRETWHYRRERLPDNVPYQQVDFVFITRPGYGTNVLQREPDALTTLAAARVPGRI